MTWKAPRDFPNLAGAKRIFFDLETKDEGIGAGLGSAWPWRGGYVLGYALGTEDREWYFPIRHPAGNMACGIEPTLRFMRDVFAESRRLGFVAHNAGYDVGWASTDGVKIEDPIWDTIFAAALLDEHRDSYALESLCQSYGIQGKDERGLAEAVERVLGVALPAKADDRERMIKGNLWQLHAKDVGPYAEGDIAATRRLWHAQRPALVRERLVDLLRLECDALPMLQAVRARGIRIDEDGVERVHEELQNAEAIYNRELSVRYGVAMKSPRATTPLGAACLRMGIETPMTKKTKKPSFAGSFLSEHPHPMFGTFRKYREAHTLRTLCLGALIKHSHGGRIYPELNPLRRDDRKAGTVSGRYSCTNPNAQQASGRTELGRLVRSLYLPEEGAKWAAADISQQEPRFIVHFADKLALPRADVARDAFAKASTKAESDWHQMVADLCGLERSQAKPINLGIGYGMGKKKLARSLGRTLAEAAPILETYDANLPFVRLLAAKCQDFADANGYIRTILGRRARFPFYEPTTWRSREEDEDEETQRFWRPRLWADAKAHWGDVPLRRAKTFQAMNRLIQGSSADQMKRAAVHLFREGYLPNLLVHDEADFPTADGPEWIKRPCEIIRDSIPLRVRVIVEGGVGANWRDAKLAA